MSKDRNVMTDTMHGRVAEGFGLAGARLLKKKVHSRLSGNPAIVGLEILQTGDFASSSFDEFAVFQNSRIDCVNPICFSCISERAGFTKKGKLVR